LENFNDFSEKLNIDDLYEKKKLKDIKTLQLFNKILNRIHIKIKITARQQIDDHFCCYLVPEIILGVAKYDNAACIAYIIDKLQTNGFNVKYYHPNLLWISWAHWVPSYVRSEIKKKTGIELDEYGKQIKVEEPDNYPNYEREVEEEEERPTQQQPHKNKKEYKPVQSYKSSGKFIYDDDMLDKINKIKINHF